MTKEYKTLEEMLAACVAKPVSHGCVKFLLLVVSPKGVQVQEAMPNHSVLLDTTGNEGTGDDFAMAVMAHLYSNCKAIL
jgi:hypothetical protein